MVSSFLPKLAAKSYNLQKQILGGLESAICGTARTIYHTVNKDLLDCSIIFLLSSRPHYRTPLQHSPTSRKLVPDSSTAENGAAEGLPVNPIAKNYRHPTSQEVVVAKQKTDPEPPDTFSAEDTTVALCAKTASEAEIALGTVLDRIENVKSKTTDTLALEVLFEVPPTELACFAHPKYKVQLGIIENR